jgi:hypothetical protein
MAPLVTLKYRKSETNSVKLMATIRKQTNKQTNKIKINIKIRRKKTKNKQQPKSIP